MFVVCCRYAIVVRTFCDAPKVGSTRGSIAAHTKRLASVANWSCCQASPIRCFTRYASPITTVLVKTCTHHFWLSLAFMLKDSIHPVLHTLPTKSAVALPRHHIRRDFVAYVSATKSHNISLRSLPGSGMATRPFSFAHQFNDTVALYGRVQIKLVILSKDKACAWLESIEAYIHIAL